jgi:TolB-like protein
VQKLSGANYALRLSAEETALFSAAPGDTASYLESRIPANTKLVVLRVASKNAPAEVSEYIVDYLTAHLVNAGKFTVVDRHHQDMIRQELVLQSAGEVDNKTAAAIGQKMGAQTIVLGSYEVSGDLQRLTIRSIDVEKAGVSGIRATLIKDDSILKALKGSHVFSRLGAPLETGLQGAAAYLASRIPAGMKLVVMINTDEAALAAYSADRLMELLVNNDNQYTVVERQYLDDLREELEFQSSGEVNDQTAVSIGKRLGAQYIVLGSFKPLGAFSRLTVRAIAVETAAITGLENYIVHQDALLLGLAREGEWAEWKHKRLYAGARLGGSYHFYDLNTLYAADVSAPVVFEAALTLDLRLTPYISLATELAYTYDSFRADSAFFSTGVYAPSLVFPLVAKVMWMPGSWYVSGFAGPYLRVPCGPLELSYNGIEEEHDASLRPGIVLGGEGGMRLGPGIIALDLRYRQDLFYARANGTRQYRAGSLSFSLGYKMGFFLTDY